MLYNNKLIDQVLQSMYRVRPKSAKQSTKMEIHDTSSLYSKQQQEPIQQKRQSPNKRAVSSKNKIISAQYYKTRRQPTTDMLHTKVLPKNIPQDKEVLYSQTIQLKQQNHKISAENTKLKTRIRVLEKENEKLMRVIESQQAQGEYPETKSRSRLTSNVTGNNQEHMKVPVMKKMVREAREEVEQLRSENETIKKSLKFTKIVELENENEVLTEEMAKMTALIDELTAEEEEQEDFKKQVEELDGYLKLKMAENQELHEKVKDFQDQMYRMEESAKQNLQKAVLREKRFQRDSEINKRRLDDATKELGILKVELSKQRLENQKVVKPASSSGVKNHQLTRNIHTPITKITQQHSNPSISTAKNQDTIKLQDQISLLKKKNEELEKKNGDLVSTVKSHESKILASDREKMVRSKNKSVQEKAIPEQKIEFEKINSSLSSYDDDFEEEKEELKTESKAGKEEEKYDLLFDAADAEGEDDEEEILYQEQKEKPKSKSKKKRAQSSKKPSKKKAQTELKQLLTYRMITQRYPFEQLKQDIEQTGEKSFKVVEISSMLHNNPFFLNDKQVKSILKLLSPEESLTPEYQIPTIQVISTLRSLIDDFELRDPKEDDEMYLKVAQMVTVYTNELEAAFEEKKNKDSMTISEKILRELFRELELEKKYVDLIVAELSLVSEDLGHLDYVEFLNRFFIDKEDMGVEEVDEEDEEDNSKTLNRSKRDDEDESQGSRFKLDKNRRREKK